MVLKSIAVFSIILLLSASSLGAYAATNKKEFSKETILVCDRIYKSYLTKTENEFVKKYSFLSYVDKCVKLFKDPVWKTTVKDRLDKIYSRYLEIKAKENSGLISDKQYVDVLSKAKIGPNKYHVKLKVCHSDQFTPNSVLLLKSDVDLQTLSLKKTTKQKMCIPYQAIVFAGSSQDIVAFIRI